MTAIKDAAAEFLSHRRVAVTGVSRTPGGHGSNAVYKRLRERGYEVFAVNPNADEVEGDRAYHDLSSIPGGVEAVVIGTRAELADGTMHECAELGIVRCRHVREPNVAVLQRADQRIAEHEVDVIRQQHDRARCQRGARTARRVGDDERGRAKRVEHAHGEAGERRVVSLIHMEAT